MDGEKMKYLSVCVIVLLSLAIFFAGCGDDDDDVAAEGSEWSEWQTYPDEDSFGELVEGVTWVHEPPFKADREREFRYDISTSRRVEAFVAPSDDCRQAAAYESWYDIKGELIIGDYSDEVSGDEDMPVCVSFHAHLISGDNPQFVVGIEYRER